MHRRNSHWNAVYATIKRGPDQLVISDRMVKALVCMIPLISNSITGRRSKGMTRYP